MVKKSLKKGFSLMEALISVLILSVFFAAVIKIKTKQPKEKRVAYSHGNFECYYNEGTLIQAKGYESADMTSEDVTSDGFCTFEPKGGKNIYNLTVIFLGDKGGHAEFIPFINENLEITPPKSTSNNCALIQNDNGEKNSYCPSDSDNYENADEIVQYINFSNPKSKMKDKIKDATGNSKVGGVIISW